MGKGVKTITHVYNDIGFNMKDMLPFKYQLTFGFTHFFFYWIYLKQDSKATETKGVTGCQRIRKQKHF